jgi:hypothetical protein
MERVIFTTSVHASMRRGQGLNISQATNILEKFASSTKPKRRVLVRKLQLITNANLTQKLSLTENANVL